MRSLAAERPVVHRRCALPVRRRACCSLIAWYDISGTADLYKQMPYLVSAGFTGLALIIVGSALLVAGRNDRVERRLAQLLDAITEAVEDDGTAADRRRRAGGASPADRCSTRPSRI